MNQNTPYTVPQLKLLAVSMDRFKAAAANKAHDVKEALIEDIDPHCGCRNGAGKRDMAKRIAIWANTTKVDE